MKPSQRKALYSILAAALLGIAAGSVYLLHRPAPAVDKPVVELRYMWPGYNLHTAAEQADFIVYGKVTEISETKVFESVTSTGDIHREYYRDVTLEVLTQLKGEAAETVVYKEMGGEAEDCVYQVSGYRPVELSEEVLLFANPHGAFLSPSAFLRVTEGAVFPSARMRPEEMKEDGIALADYLDCIAEILE